MRTCLSITETIAAIAVAAFLCAPQAYALVSDYSTDMEEPDVMTVKNSYCCLSTKMKQEVNVQMNVEDALLSGNKPVKVSVINADQQPVTEFTTRDKQIYMHLPEGKYTIKVDGQDSHSKFDVAATETSLQSYTIQPLYLSYAQAGANHSEFLQQPR